MSNDGDKLWRVHGHCADCGSQGCSSGEGCGTFEPTSPYNGALGGGSG